MKNLFSFSLFLVVLTTPVFSKFALPLQAANGIGILVVDEIPQRYRVTPLEYDGATTVVIEILNSNNQVINSAPTTPGRAVDFPNTGQEYKVRGKFLNDAGYIIFVDEMLG